MQFMIRAVDTRGDARNCDIPMATTIDDACNERACRDADAIISLR